MALGVTPLRVGQEAYWLDQIARDRCEYYSGKGESPGWWAGALAERTGLTGVAEDEAVQRLFAGQNPLTGEQRILPLWRADPRSRLETEPLQAALREVAAARGIKVSELATGERFRNQLQRLSGTRKVSTVVVERVCRTVLDRNPEEFYGDAYTEARKHVGKRIDARVASFDLSFSDPKSVSLLAAGSRPEVRAEVQAARHVAIRKVLGWLEQEAIGVRRGHNGIDRFRGSGITAAAFDHRTSREGDPQWHTHVLVQNATVGPDGRWSALDSRRLYAHAMTADRLYHATLRAELTRRLDVRWRPVDQRSGAAEIDGLHDRNLVRAFSKRRAQVLAQQQRWGHAGIAAGKAAAIATRKPKDHSEPEASFYERVAQGLVEHGIGPAELEQVCRGGHEQVRQLSQGERERLLDELAGPGGLTAQASTFARRDVLDALAKQLPVAASADQALAALEELADDFLGSERAVLVTVDRGLDEPRYSTPELLNLERGLVEQAERRAGEQAAVVAGEHVRATLQARPGLDADQEAMVRQVSGDGAGISLVVGYAGSGKTYATGAAVDAFRRQGMQVTCTAPTGAAARELERETNSPAPTIDSLLGQLRRRSERLDRHSVVVVDEAAMVGTRKLAQLLGYADRAGSKVLMIGDDRQLAAIDTGGAFRAFRLRLGASELRGNHRQRTQLGQDVAGLFRNHQQDEAMDQLVAHGKVIVCRSEAEANAAQVRDWWHRFRRGQQAGMIAFSRAEITRLNTAAREHMTQDRRLGPEALQVGEREFRVGDRIVCGRNARTRLGVVNGTRGQVVALDPSQRTLTITTDDGKTVLLPSWYVAGRGHDDQPWVDHGYAITGHKTQGLTGDDFGVRPSTRADANWSYVAASRHRFDLRLYLVEELDRPAEDTRHTSDPLDDRVEATVRAMGRPGEQTFAIDQELLAEVRQLTVPQLRQERDRLRELLAGAPVSVAHRITLAEERQRQAEAHLTGAEAASPATGGWAGRAWRRRPPDPGRPGGHPATAPAAAVRVADQAAAELVDLRRQQQQRTAFLERHQPAGGRYRAVVAELGWRTRATSRALELDPPPWLTGLLGDIPEASRGRRAWRQTAARLHSYRDSYQLSDPERTLGQEPTGNLTQRRAWRAAHQAIDRYQRQHRTREQRQERPQDRDRRSTRTGRRSGSERPAEPGSKEPHDGQLASQPRPASAWRRPRLLSRRAGVRIRPVTFAELEDYLEHLANPTERPPLPRARVVDITSPQPGFIDQQGRPGRSAMAEYRRRRTADWQSWKPTLAFRIAAVLAAGLSVGLLTAAVASSGLAWLTGLAAATALAWRLRFRPTADTLAWRRGAHGERRTARLLAPLERQGYDVFHDLAIPGSAANVDHLVVGPTGVFVIDSKRYRGELHYSAGRLWHGRRPLDRTLDTLWWEAIQVAETLGFGPDLHVYPVLCIHVARLPWRRELLVDGIPVLAAGALRPALQTTRQALSPEQVDLVAANVQASFQPAA